MTLTTIFWLVVFGFVFYMMVKGGGCCGGHDHGGHDQGTDKHEGHDDMSGGHHHQMVGNNVPSETDKDPVCGMDVKNGSLASEHLGKTFHFCSDQCRKLFDLNPHKYMENHGG